MGKMQNSAWMYSQMAHLTLNQYLHLVDEAIQACRGHAIADLLSCRHSHIASARLKVEDPVLAVRNVLDTPWNEVISAHLKCVEAISDHDFIAAYKQQFSLAQTFTKVLQGQKEENWGLPIMYTCCLDLRILATNADIELARKSKFKPAEMLEKSADLIMGFFRVCAGDNRTVQEDSKRWGMLYLVNQLFKIYFKINKLHLCKPLIRAIESSTLKDHFKVSQRVTYKYYVGQKAMFESDFKNAEECLSFAFQHCHQSCTKNKRLILIYLIPVKMLLGHMPSMKLLEKYDLLQFSEIVRAVTAGNLLKFNSALAENDGFFIRCGIYVILERLRNTTYRNLFKKVHLILNTFQIPVDAFFVALKFMQEEDIDHEEVLCILANLIYEGKIKGYISYQHQKVVVSKQNAFPALSSLN